MLPPEDPRQQAGTPLVLFEQLNTEYRFSLDVCAMEHNHKLPRYWTREQNSLKQCWVGERVWCNPPYDNILPWLYHALEAELTAYLLPARTDRDWYQHFKKYAEAHYFRGRVNFIPAPGVTFKTGNGGGNVLLLFGQGCTPGLERWRDAKTGLLLP